MWTTYKFHDGQFATAKNLTYALSDKINYTGCVPLMYQLLKDIAFKHRKISDGCKFLLARDENTTAHIKVSKNYAQFKDF